MANKTVINWQDKYLCDTILANKNEKEKEFDSKYYALQLTKYYIYNDLSQCNSDISTIKRMVADNNKLIYEKALSYVHDEDRATAIVKSIEKGINNIMSPKEGKNPSVFFNDKPIIIYQSEIDKIVEIGKRFTYNSRCGKKPREMLQKIIAVLLIWQKAYNNAHSSSCEYAPVIEDKINTAKILTDNGSESGTRVKNYQDLIQAGYIEYYRPEILEKRKKKPIYLYKIPFISYNIDGTDKEVVRIDKFDLLCEQVFSGFDKSIIVNECQKCNRLFLAKRPSTKNCNVCNRH